MLYFLGKNLKRAFRGCMGWGEGVWDHTFEKCSRDYHRFCPTSLLLLCMLCHRLVTVFAKFL